MENISRLVRDDLVVAAHANHQALTERLAAARQDVAETQRKLDAAWAGSKAAVAASAGGAAKGPVLDLEKAVREAEAHLTFAKRLVEELEAQVATAHAGIIAAQGESYRPVLERGIEIRIAATQKAEKARALLAEAEGEYREGAKLVLAAKAKGTKLRFALDGALLELPIATELAERSFWEGYR